MEYRVLGKSELKVPVVSFGAWAIGGWMWGGTDDAAAVRAIHRAIDEGMTLIDTAPTYGMGHSERVVGEAIRGRRDEVLVATKCGIRWDLEGAHDGMKTVTNEGKEVTLVRNLTPESIFHEVDQSLQRLGIDRIDLYQCHWPDPKTPVSETMDALLEIQKQGKVRAIGVSNFTVEMMQDCLKKGYIASDQPKYNPLEREIEKDVLPFCAEQEMGVLAYSPIAQGLMTGKVTPERAFEAGDARADKPWFSVENRRRVLAMLEKIKPIAQAHDATLAQVATRWIIDQPGVTTAIVGARDEEQVTENAKAGSINLSAEELASIRAAVEELGEPV
ncbi:MAG: aldo/keto reductase [Candidatus Hydrogenedentes bacterium]|nr:aldo/keto reductase [Candidatus Hydrogenedentota bacterium]